LFEESGTAAEQGESRGLFVTVEENDIRRTRATTVVVGVSNRRRAGGRNGKRCPGKTNGEAELNSRSVQRKPWQSEIRSLRNETAETSARPIEPVDVRPSVDRKAAMARNRIPSIASAATDSPRPLRTPSAKLRLSRFVLSSGQLVHFAFEIYLSVNRPVRFPHSEKPEPIEFRLSSERIRFVRSTAVVRDL